MFPQAHPRLQSHVYGVTATVQIVMLQGRAGESRHDLHGNKAGWRFFIADSASTAMRFALQSQNISSTMVHLIVVAVIFLYFMNQAVEDATHSCHPVEQHCQGQTQISPSHFVSDCDISTVSSAAQVSQVYPHCWAPPLSWISWSTDSFCRKFDCTCLLSPCTFAGSRTMPSWRKPALPSPFCHPAVPLKTRVSLD